MSEGDLDLVLRRLAVLERAVVNRRRFGRIAKDGVKKGKVRVEIGGDNEGQPLLTPWLRTGMQHGFVNENIPFEEGQSVSVSGLDGDITLARVEALSYTEHDPLPEDADPKKHSYRIRKPREEKKDQAGQQQGQPGGQQGAGGSGSGAGGGGGDNMWSGGQQPKEYKPKEMEKQKDKDEEDHYFRRDWEGHFQRKKKAKWLFGEPEPEKQQQQGQQSGGTSGGATQQKENESKGSGEDKEQQWFEVGSASITIVDGKIRFKVGKNVMILDGKGLHTRIGDDTDTPEKPQKKKISEDKDDVSGKFQHQITKQKREIKAPDDGPSTLLDTTKVQNKTSKVTIIWDTKTKTTGGRIEHESKNIGVDHKHGQVMPGGGLTGDPEN